MTLKLFDTIGNGQESAARDFGIGYFGTFKLLPVAGGGWIVVGKADAGEHQGQIVAQRIDVGGDVVGPEAVLVTGADVPSGAGYGLADATLLANGSLALSVSVNLGNTDFSSTPIDVYTRVFAAGSYAPLGSMVQADTDQSDGQQYAGPITALADGGFAVVWRDAYSTESGQQFQLPDGTYYSRLSDMRIRAFNADGTARAGPYLAQGTGAGDLLFNQGAGGQDVVGLAGGRIVTAFSDTEIRTGSNGGTRWVDGNSFHISTSSGAAAGVADDASIGAFFANPGEAEGSLWGNVQLVATSDGGFTAFFAERYIIRGDYGSVAHVDFYVKAQHYDADGAAAGAETIIDASRDAAIGATMAATQMADGRYALAYTKDFGDANGGADPALVVLSSNLGSAELLRLEPGGQNNVYSVVQDADGNLLVTYGGGSPSHVARVVDAVPGSVVQSGTTGDDSLTGSDASDWLAGRAGDDTLQGMGGNDHLFGGADNDTLSGGAGTNILLGGAGNDTIVSTGVHDTIDGGDNDDVVYLGKPGTPALLGGSVQGGAGSDTLSIDATFDGSSAATTFGGFETVTGANGYAYLTGSAAADALDLSSLTASNPFTLYVFTGGGNDILVGSGGNDIISGEAGDDTLSGGIGDDVVLGGEGKDLLLGNPGNDQLVGNQGDDILYGGQGDDILYGGQDNDTLYGGVGNDSLQGNLGNDTLSGDDGDDFLYGNEGNDLLVGNAGNDTLYGGQDNDTLIGGQGDDTLLGGAGNDVLTGGAGTDTLSGGAGIDIFRFNAATDSPVAAPDIITDFQTGADKIDLLAVHTALSDSFSISSSGGNTFVAVDLGGNGTVDMRIQVSGANAVATSDILWTAGSGSGVPDADDAPIDHAPNHPTWIPHGDFEGHYAIA